MKHLNDFICQNVSIINKEIREFSSLYDIGCLTFHQMSNYSYITLDFDTGGVILWTSMEEDEEKFYTSMTGEQFIKKIKNKLRVFIDEVEHLKYKI